MKTALVRASRLILLAFAACGPGPKRLPPVSRPSTSTSAATPSPAPSSRSESDPTRLRLTVAGDVTLGFHYEEQFDRNLKSGAERERLLGYGFEEVKAAVAGSDLFLVNLECPFTDRGEKLSKNFNFRARPELAETLLRGGVGAVTVANNHMMDYGEVGLLDTLATLDKLGLPHFGAGRNLAQARQPAIVERNGVKVALLGYLFLGPKHIEPQAVFATETAPGVAGHYFDVDAMERMVREDVAAAKARAELVIPYFHWGREGQHLPEAYQQRLARAAIESGAAAVLGAHPHVLQGLELYRGAPIAYSLGNFIFGGNWNPRDKESLLFKARFSDQGYLGAELVPVLVDRYPERPMQPNVPEGERARTLLRNVATYSQGFEQPLPELNPYRPAAPPADADPRTATGGASGVISSRFPGLNDRAAGSALALPLLGQHPAALQHRLFGLGAGLEALLAAVALERGGHGAGASVTAPLEETSLLLSLPSMRRAGN